MSESSGSSFTGTTGASSVASSENTDARALTAMQSGGEGDNDDLEANSRGLLEAGFSTIYTLTKNRALETAPRLAVLKVLLEWLQLFLVLLNPTFPWHIASNTFIWQAIQWLLVRNIILPKGYDMYITVLYIMAALILATILATIWVAVVLKGDDASNVWLRRLIMTLQFFAMIIYSIMWPAVLDYFVFTFDCKWRNVTAGGVVNHMIFTDEVCTKMPHLAHMVFAGIMAIVFGGMTLLMSVGVSDMNPMTRSILASSDATTTFKILLLKMGTVVISGILDDYQGVQLVLILVLTYGAFYFHLVELPFYGVLVNTAWTGLSSGLLMVAVLLVALGFAKKRHLGDPYYDDRMTMAVLYAIFPAVLLGGAAVWLRMRQIKKLSDQLRRAFEDRKLQLEGGEAQAEAVRESGASVVSMMGDLKAVYRFKDVRQVSLLCRAMRKWDDDGIPDKDASEFGEFILKAAMARMPNSPSLLVMFTNFLVEVRKDGQAARTQVQLALKANPSILDQFNIFVAQQLAKLLKRETGDTLDLMSYIEYQRSYRACVRVHKLALMAQRQFWNSLLRDTIQFKDIQKSLEAMEAAEARATAMYRRVLERYPSNGKLLKVYGRFLEYVRNDPWTAGKFYDEALKQGTTESLLSMTQGQTGSENLANAGNINEKVDGLVIINAQGVVLMINAAALGLFGYEKGELEGKNVSLLMPQPFSTHHNSFLQRYLSTGQPHILNRSRHVVGLHKDRSLFPMTLFVTRLSGMGSDTLFMGVVRRPPPVENENGNVVRFWGTANGTIMCVDSTVIDNYGYKPVDMVGQNFATLCTGNLETITRFITNFSGQKSEISEGGIRTQDQMKVQIMHAFLPPVDVELNVELAGAVDTASDCRIVVMNTRVLSDAGAVMVLDRKSRLVYVTEKLAVMLGYPVATLVKMDINALLPQPYCQMHGTWFKEYLTRKPGPTSCRAGGVVHLLASNGTKVPVTLKMSQREAPDAGGGLLHVVHVTRASEGQRLDQTRLLLDINHKGTILDVNTGAPKSLYGFNVSELVGRPLASIVDVFGMWRHEFKEDSSLLTLLTLQALKEGTPVSVSKSDSALHASGTSWRVGVHQPIKDEDIESHAVQLAEERQGNRGHGSEAGGAGAAADLLHALQQRRRLHSACMSFEVLEREDGEVISDSAVAETTPVVQVSLYRSDALTATIELDKNLAITRLDDAMGLMFGVSARKLVKKSFPRLVGLPSGSTFDDLLGTKAPVAKKTAMRRSATGGPPAAGTSRMGITKKLTAHHLGDGKPLQIELQAMSFEQNGKLRYMVRIQLQNPTSASMEALLQLRKDGQAADAAARAKAALVDASADGAAAGDLRHGADSDEEDSPKPAAVLNQRGLSNQGSFNRTSDWVREASSLPGAHGESPPISPNRRGSSTGPEPPVDPRHRKASDAGMHFSADSYEAGYDSAYISGKQKDMPLAVRKDASLDFAEPYNKGKEFVQGPGSAAGSASIGGSSAGDGASEAGGQSVTSAATGGDEDLAVDTRRAKRLRKLNRMLHSSVALFSTNRWRMHTLFLLATILVAHVVCFVVLTTQINRRYTNANNVADMTRGLARMQMIVLRSNYIQKCKLPDFATWWACTPDNVEKYIDQLGTSNDLAHQVHQVLYLGVSGLKPFADERLMNYWTYTLLPEYVVYPTYVAENGTKYTDYLAQSHRTLWEMGNVLVSAGRDLYFSARTWGADMDKQPVWQYIYQNGPKSLFDGYAWSLDTYVDYAWQDLLTLATLLIILLVVEALVVQMSCMAYEFRLVQQCNVSHMRLFSVFLALPSATVRLMAQRQLQVDDDTKDDLDDDDFEIADAGAAGAATAGNEAGEASAKKSVRMDLAEGEEEDNKGKKGKARRGSDDQASDDGKLPVTRPKKGAASTNKVSKKAPLTGWPLFKKTLYKKLFGWLDPKFKMNGKKLVADSRIVWRFMIPLLLWVAAVIVIFGVSYSSLQGLQGPLASLDTASHVLYRVTRIRLFSGMMGFSIDETSDAYWRGLLKQELKDLRTEYNTLLYGGPMMLKANVTFKPVAPASAFADSSISQLFFRTTDCLRADQSTCYNDPASPFYQITHSGLDAQINRYLDEMTRFSSLPVKDALANHSTFEFQLKVAANDMADGLNTAADLFVAWTISRFESVKQLHVILLVISLVLMVLFVLMLYQPYLKQLHRDSKVVAAMLSQLPAEVDVEGQVKSVVLGMVKGSGGSSANASLMLGPSASMMGPNPLAGPPGMSQALTVPPAPGMGGPPVGMPPGADGWYGAPRRWNDSADGYPRRGPGGGPPMNGNPYGSNMGGYGKDAGAMGYEDDEV